MRYRHARRWSTSASSPQVAHAYTLRCGEHTGVRRNHTTEHENASAGVEIHKQKKKKGQMKTSLGLCGVGVGCRGLECALAKTNLGGLRTPDVGDDCASCWCSRQGPLVGTKKVVEGGTFNPAPHTKTSCRLECAKHHTKELL